MKRDLARLANQTFDVLVIGGGIHGAISAWDAALRGLSVALIERSDFGSGTSQNSLKIIHGGLRYLQDANLSRIRTLARERTTWMKIAPHLVHPLTCLTPTRKEISRSRLAMGIALTANDILSFDRNRLADPQKKIEKGRIISQQEFHDLLPGYDVQSSTGAAVWHDAQIFNSERLLLEFILSAADAGAQVANYVEAVGFLTDGKRINGVTARNGRTGEALDIQSKMVINCTGAWIDSALEKINIRSEHATSVAMNIFVDQIWADVAAGLPTRPAEGKPPQILFFVPWRDKTMIGTWHIPWHNDPGAFKLSESMVQNFINAINTVHPPLKLELDDVKHVTWGFLPVSRQDAHRDQVRLTRDGVVIDHQKKDGISGLISVLGVKYTTAPVVAQRAVDVAVNKLAGKARPCQTHTIPVKGGYITDFRAFLNKAIAESTGNVDEDVIHHLVYTYGSEYAQIESYNLSQRIDPYLPVTEAEVIRAVREEMALTLPDVVQRRTELGACGLPPMIALQKCAELMGRELNWSIERQQQEIDSVIQAYPIRHGERAAA